MRDKAGISTLFSSLGIILSFAVLVMTNFIIFCAGFFKGFHIFTTLPLGASVTERNQAKAEVEKERTAELRESEARFRELVDNAHTIILKMDLAGRVTFFNEFAQRFFGYSEDEILGKHIVGTIVPDIETTGRDLRKTIGDILLHTEQYRTHENENITKDGTRKWVAWTNKIVEDEAGKPIGVLSTGADMTERKQAEHELRQYREHLEELVEERTAELATVNQQLRQEIVERQRTTEALQETNERLVNTLESISDGFFTLDDDLVVTYFNRAAEQLLGRKGEEVLGHSLFEAFPEAGGSIFEEKYTRAVREKKSVSFETYFGVQPYENWYEVRVYPSRDGISVYFQVTTERKRAEAQLIQYRDHLEELVEARTAELKMTNERLEQEIAERQRSEMRFRSLFETMAGGVVLIAPDGQIVQANPAAEHILELKRSEIEARDYVAPAWEILRPDGTPMPPEEMAGPRAMKERRPVKDVVMGVKRPDGSISWISASATPLTTKPGSLEGVVGTFVDITERVRVEEAYRALVDHSLQGLLILQDGRIAFANQAFAAMSGYTAEELLALSLEEIPTLVHPADRSLLLDFYQSHRIEGSAPGRKEWCGLRKDGTVAWVEIYASQIEYRGKPALQMAVVDITERKQADEALRESEARYRELVDNAHTIILKMDLQGRLTFFNEFAQRFFDYSEDEILGKHIVGTIVPDIETTGRDLRKIIGDILWHTERYRTHENENLTKEGVRKWIAWTNKVIEDERGKPVGVLSTGTDITERKQAEVALRAAERLFSYYVDSIDAFVYIKDTESNYTFVNKKAEELFNIRREDLKKRPYTDFDFFEAQMAQALRENDRQVMESGQPVEFEEIGRPEGKQNRELGAGYRYYLSLKFPLKDEQGTVIGVCGFSYEITERKRIEEALRQAKIAAEAANRAKSVFLANMSHELRTPLNAILGFSQVMTRDPDLTTKQQENLAIISRNGEHLLELINDVLDMSAIEAGRVTLLAERFDLHHLLAGLVEMFRLRAEGKGLALVFDRDPNLPQYVRADEGKLRQVLINLLGNAVKFTHEGNITLHVRYIDERPTTGDQPPTVEEQPPFVVPPSSLVFTIEDTGPGIAPDELETVFDPFVQTTSGQQSEEGTGLGLPISREFVRLMGGDLTVSSVLGQGSTFKFDIKIELVDQAEIETFQAKSGIPVRRVVGLVPGQPVYRLLIADDREASRKLLVELLSPLGFEIQTAGNGQEAIEIWAKWKPHLILMDMRMPVMDGHEATRRIKATAKGQSTVIIAVTASALAENRASFMADGCDDFVSKPFREAELFEKLTRHLGMRFVYEETETAGRDRLLSQPDTYPPEISSAEFDQVLASLPAGWIEKLKQATIQTDLDLILTLVQQIRELDSQNLAANVTAALADRLTDMARNFEYEQISTLIRSLESRSEDQDA